MTSQTHLVLTLHPSQKRKKWIRSGVKNREEKMFSENPNCTGLNLQTLNMDGVNIIVCDTSQGNIRPYLQEVFLLIGWLANNRH